MRETVDGDPEAPENYPSAEQARDDEHARCWVCGAAVVDRHCKIVCPRCGFTRDCSDP